MANQDDTRKKILSIGNVSVDIKAYSPEEETEGYRDGTIELVPGGVGRGMAINLKHLGFETFIYSYVGNDIFGDYLRKGLQKEKIDTTLLFTSPTQETSLFSVMTGAKKKSSCIYNTKILREIDFDEKIISFIEENGINVLAVDSNLREETYAQIYKYKKSHPEIFIFQNATAPDIARKTIPYAHLIDLFACNEFEASAILDEKEILPDLSMADKMQQIGFKNFIVTFGSQGVMVRIGNDTWNEPPYTPSNIVDTIGAGDAFASGFLMGFLSHQQVKNCIHYGLICAKETLLTRQTVSDSLSRDFLESYKIKT